MKNLNLKAKVMSLAASALLACGCLNASAQDRPNIILIISDDHTWTHYGFMGHPEVQTPHLDRMAGEGLLYTRVSDASGLRRQLKQPIPVIAPADSRYSGKKKVFFAKNLKRPE